MESPEPVIPQALDVLFLDESTKQVSKYHLLNRIILNPRVIAAFIHQTSELGLLKHIAALLEIFPLNRVHVACSCDIFATIVESAISNSRVDSTKDPCRDDRAAALMKLFDLFLEAKDLPLAVFKRLNSLIVQDYYSEGITHNTFETAIKLTSKIYNRLLQSPPGSE